MAFEYGGKTISLISSGDNSGNQYLLIKQSTAGNATICTAASDKPIGVIQNTPSTGGGDAASVQIDGVSKVMKNSTSVAAIAIGDSLVPTTAGGIQPKTAETLGQYIIGEAMTAMSSGSTGPISMIVTHEGRGSSGA